jgi:predicted outer membrane protein
MNRDWTSRVLARLAVVLAVGCVVVLPAAPVRADGLPDGWTATQFGPLGPADRDLLVKIRLAGLWEMPAGDKAQRRAVNPKVRDIAAKISAEHHELDEAVRSAAVQLAVDLPNEPNADQRGWLTELDNAEGAAFDQVFIDRLRAAHGKVFSVIAGVRAGTRNDAVRAFAVTANAAVLRHMGYLESSGLVDWEVLPVPPDPPNPAEVTHFGGLGSRGVHPILIWIVLAVAVVAGVVTTSRAIRIR